MRGITFVICNAVNIYYFLSCYIVSKADGEIAAHLSKGSCTGKKNKEGPELGLDLHR